MADAEQNFGSGLLGYVMLMDPTTGKPYKAQNVIQQTDGEFNTTGLATEEMQGQEVAAMNAVASKLDGPLTVHVNNSETPLASGAATDAKQDSIITALGNLASLLGGNLKVSIDGQPLQAQITSATLPTGAATSANQADVKTALNAVLTALAGVLEISGDVNVTSDEPLEVAGTVHIDNTTFSVTPSGIFDVTVSGGATSAKQDALIATLQDVLTRLSNPLPVSDGGQSITVDGVVGVSGTIPVSQSGAWNVGVNGTVPISAASLPTHPVTQSGTWDVNVTNQTAIPVTLPGTQPVSLASVPTHAVTQSGTWTFLPANAATLTTSPTAVSVGTTSVTIAASNTSRKSLIVQNMGNTTLYLSFAATAVATAPTFQVPANNWISIDRDTWTGSVTGIRASGSASADAIVTVTS